MTSRLSPAAALDEVIREARHLLFAFDGPIRSAAAGNPPAPYIHDVLTACRESGRSAAIIPTTPVAEVRAYLDVHHLSTQIEIVAASIGQAVSALDASPTDCVAITSSLEDTATAQATGIHTIAYANKPSTQQRMTEINAAVVIASMADLALSLRAMSLRARR